MHSVVCEEPREDGPLAQDRFGRDSDHDIEGRVVAKSFVGLIIINKMGFCLTKSKHFITKAAGAAP